MPKDFNEILRTVPSRRSRSPLEPYRPLIEELRRRGLSYRAIAGVLADHCCVETSHVAVRALAIQQSPRALATPSAAAPVKAVPTPMQSGDFLFEPNEPLRLRPAKIRTD